MRHAVSQAYDAVMNCWVAKSVVVLACVLTCQPSIYTQALVATEIPRVNTQAAALLRQLMKSSPARNSQWQS